MVAHESILACTPFLFGPCQPQNTQKYIGHWYSFGPQTSIFELSLVLYGPPGKIIKNHWSMPTQLCNPYKCNTLNHTMKYSTMNECMKFMMVYESHEISMQLLYILAIF